MPWYIRVFALRGHGTVIDSQKTALSKVLKWFVTHGQVFRKDHKFRLTPAAIPSLYNVKVYGTHGKQIILYAVFLFYFYVCMFIFTPEECFSWLNEV